MRSGPFYRCVRCSAQLGAGGHAVIDEHQVQLLLTVLLMDGGGNEALLPTSVFAVDLSDE